MFFRLLFIIFVIYVVGMYVLKRIYKIFSSSHKTEANKNIINPSLYYVWADGTHNIVRCAICGKEIAIDQKYYLREALDTKHWTIKNNKPYCPTCCGKNNIEPNATTVNTIAEDVPLGEKEFV